MGRTSQRALRWGRGRGPIQGDGLAVLGWRHLGHAPLFQVMPVLQNALGGALELPGLALEAAPAEERTAKFDLTLTVVGRAAGAVRLQHRPVRIATD